MQNWISRIAVAAVLSAAGASVALAETTVGLLLPKSGVFAALGAEIDDGFMFALEEAGRVDEFTIVREDTEVKPPVGLAKARKLVLQDKVDTIVGVVSSGVLGAMRDFVHQAKVPLMLPMPVMITLPGKAVARILFGSLFPTARSTGQWASGCMIRAFARSILLPPIMLPGTR